MITYVEWSEPFSTEDPFPVINRCKAEHIVKWMMKRHPYESYEQALEDFCVVHHATRVEEFE